MPLKVFGFVEQHRPLYDEFSNILTKAEFATCLRGDKIAVACSGGTDSLALSLLLGRWCLENGRDLVALIVDHGLRSESAEEALSVRGELSKFGIAAEILTGTSDTKRGRGGLQARARELRYNLLLNYCREHSITNLFVGHHLRDQAETFLLRLRRGSHIKGLGCMVGVSQVSGVYILRPLLGVGVNILHRFVQDSGAVVAYDPSNDCDDFERVRMRKLLPMLAEVGLDDVCFAATAERMRLAGDFIDSVARQYIEELREGEDGCILGSRDLWRRSHVLLHYVLLSYIWDRLDDRDYPPRGRSFERLAGVIIGGDDCIRELGRVRIICRGDDVIFCRMEKA